MTAMLLGFVFVLGAQAIDPAPPLGQVRGLRDQAGTPSKEPFNKLFVEPGDRKPARNDHSGLEAKVRSELVKNVQSFRDAPSQKPRVVCGLTVIAADPTIDPKIRMPIPDDGVDFKIRRLRPPLCNE